MVLNGDYIVSGRILIAPIEGKGKFVAEIGKLVNAKNWNYLTVKKVKKTHPMYANKNIQCMAI